MRWIDRSFVALLSCLTAAVTAAAATPGPAVALQSEVVTPAEHLGHPLAADGVLPGWAQVSGYFHRLAEQSPRVTTEVVGQTTEGRDFLLSVITSEANHTRLDEIRAQCRSLSDPRGLMDDQLVSLPGDGPVVLFVSCAMHATECAGTQFAMQFGHDLATEEGPGWDAIRENVVVLLAPSLNPDGLDHVSSWYGQTVGGPHEGSGLLKLYQYYAGHDNNRDWFMLTQAETRIVTELLYTVWRPQVYWDVHQQGGSKERLFVPPFRDPLNPNLDPAIIAGIDLLGTRALFDLTAAGLTGVSTGVTYDMWWNGGNRNVPVRHNIIGLLTEAASCDLASPVFRPRSSLRAPGDLGGYAPSNRFPAPWPGGWWRMRDIVDYELAFGRSLLGSLAREPGTWRRNALQAAVRALDVRGDQAPRAWVLPSDQRDPSAVRRLVDVLLRTGVEMFVAQDEFAVDGRTWPAGSIVISREQPYGSHVKDLFEVQRYPEGAPPYDVAGWTLPLLLGVQRVECIQLPVLAASRVTRPEDATAAFAGDPRVADRRQLLSLADSGAWTRLFEWLGAGNAARFATDGALAGTVALGAGAGGEEDEFVLERMPRVGVYAPWRGLMNEGWLRWVLDSFELPYVSVRNEMLRAGELERFVDVLVLPSLSPGQLDRGRPPGSVPDDFAGGLDPEGAVAVEEFVRRGGTLVCLSDSAAWAIELFGLPLVDVAKDDESGFSCPGSVLRTIPEPGPWSAGLPASLAVFFSRSSAWRVMDDDEREEAGFDERQVEALLRYAPQRLLLSGWIEEPEAIGGQIAWARVTHGEGSLHLFGFRPQYRGWSQAAFPLLFRAILFSQAAGG